MDETFAMRALGRGDRVALGPVVGYGALLLGWLGLLAVCWAVTSGVVP